MVPENDASGETRPSSAEGYWRSSVRLTAQSWRQILDRRSLGANVSAGITVAMVALPLNLALAIACGLPPAVGLLTGAIAGAVAALLGGARFQITGPEVALVPITFDLVTRFGVQGLLVATALAGLFQIGLGLLRVGRVINAIPTPVVGGFLAAVGLMVLDSQLPRFLGLAADVRLLSGIRDVRILASADLEALGLGLLVLATVVLLPRRWPRLPAPLLAIGVAIAVVAGFGLTIPTVAPIESTAVRFAMPGFAAVDVAAILPEALVLALLASMDSLLCAISIEPRAARETADQELVAQGCANLVSAFLGGMPVAAAVVRSRAAVDAGASTRLTPVVQSLVLALVLFAMAPLLTHVPLVALAGILLMIGYRLIDWRQLVRLWAVARFEGLVFIFTAIGILVSDFVAGVLVGVIAALVHFAHAQRQNLRAFAAPFSGGDLPVHRAVAAGHDIRVLRVEGPLFFGSTGHVEDAVAGVVDADRIVLDLSRVHSIDATGAAVVARALKALLEQGARIWVVSASAPPLLALTIEGARCSRIRRVARLEEAIGDATAGQPAPGPSGAAAAMFPESGKRFGVPALAEAARNTD